MQRPAMDYDRLACDFGAHRRPNPDVLGMLASIAAAYGSPRMLEVGAGTGNFVITLTAIGAGTLRDDQKRAGFVDIEEHPVLSQSDMTSIQPYRDKAYSSLILISDEAFACGISRLEDDLRYGPIKAEAPYTLVIARRPEE